MIRAMLVLFAALMALPLGAQDSMPPAPYAYNQLDDPAKEAEAAALMQGSEMLRAAFGPDVVDHYHRAALWEIEEQNRVVTDWEVARGFERA